MRISIATGQLIAERTKTMGAVQGDMDVGGPEARMDRQEGRTEVGDVKTNVSQEGDKWVARAQDGTPLGVFGSREEAMDHLEKCNCTKRKSVRKEMSEERPDPEDGYSSRPENVPGYTVRRDGDLLSHAPSLRQHDASRHASKFGRHPSTTSRPGNARGAANG